jgi:hypothetical protein
LLGAEIHSLIPPWHGAPIRLLAGAGIAAALGIRENASGAPLIATATAIRITFRAGLELALGRSSRAPRVQFTRSAYSKRIISMDRLDALALLFSL